MDKRKSVKTIETAVELLAFIQEDPFDRVLDYRNRSSLTIMSISALGVTTINEYVKAMSEPQEPHHAEKATLARVVPKKLRNNPKHEIAPEIIVLCRAAEALAPGRLLSLAGYEGICILASHPDAEVGEAAWFAPVGTQNTIDR